MKIDIEATGGIDLDRLWGAACCRTVSAQATDATMWPVESTTTG